MFRILVAIGAFFVAGHAWAGPSAYTCGQYLRDLSLAESQKSAAFNNAVGFTYGAYYMANWQGSFVTDEDKLDRFDRSIIANCRMQSDDAFFAVAIKTALDYRQH